MNILIINQHGENRGDESALTGLIFGIEKNLKRKINFTVLGQFKDQSYEMKVPDKKIKSINIVFSPLKYILLIVYTLLMGFLKIEPRFILTKKLKIILAEYEKSDIILSAPGGGYIGDNYKSHEFIHWLYIYLGKIYKKKLMLYSPSVGPFKDPIFNFFRKKILNMFNQITLRESKSITYINELDKNINVTLSADASLCFKVDSLKEIKKNNKGKFIVTIVASDYKFKKNYLKNKTEYINSLLKIIIFLNSKKNIHCIFMPQLVGSKHNDFNYQKSIASMLPPSISWEILDKNLDSTYQKRLFSASDFAISSRYHPGIFATSAGVPGIFFAYEHKQIGYFKDLKYKFFYDINKFSNKKIIKDTDFILKNYKKIKKDLNIKIKPIITRSEKAPKILKNLILDIKNK